MEWARDKVYGKPKASELAVIPVSGADFSLRTIPGTDISGFDPARFIELDELGRELVAIDADQKVRRPLVKGRFVEVTDELLGVMGTHRDRDHGNVNVTAVPERNVVFDSQLIKRSIGERAKDVFVTQTEYIFSHEGALTTIDGQAVSPERALEVLKHALLGYGIDPALVSGDFIEQETERLNQKALAQAILDGVAVEGITVAFEKRVEPDAVVSHLPIKVRRPRRRKIELRKKSS